MSASHYMLRATDPLSHMRVHMCRQSETVSGYIVTLLHRYIVTLIARLETKSSSSCILTTIVTTLTGRMYAHVYEHHMHRIHCTMYSQFAPYVKNLVLAVKNLRQSFHTMHQGTM